jgi:hypothetical protein
MIKYIAHLSVEVIQQELDNCEEAIWHDTKAWSNPIDYSVSTLSPAAASGASAIREQDRLHVIWQTDISGSDQSWWSDPNWRNRIPMPTAHARFFPGTLQIVTEFCKQQNYKLDRLFFSRLLPKAVIYAHRDVAWGIDFENNSRLGLSITTNRNCSITAGAYSANPEVGTVFWFDHNELHSAENQGQCDRIVLYMDVKPKVSDQEKHCLGTVVDQ